MKNLFVYIFIIISTLSLGSCTINSYVMLKTPRDFEFDTPPANPKNEYIIAANDQMVLRLYSNDGFQIFDLTNQANTTNNAFNNSYSMKYRIEDDSTCNLPIIGSIKLAGLTIIEAEEILEKKYSEYYVDPYAQIQITNQRVLVFVGTGNSAKVVYLQNNNTTLLEAIALAGGISTKSKANDIKIIRRTPAKDEVYHVDLSTIEGLQYANMVVQGNDIVYVQPVKNIAPQALSNIAPILSLITTPLLIIYYFRRLK